MATPNKRPPCVLCDAVDHACSVCGLADGSGAHRGCFRGGVFVQLWRCMDHLYDRSQDDAKPPAKPERLMLSPTFIKDPGRAAEMTRIVLLIETTTDSYTVEETADGAYWKAGMRATLPRHRWKLAKETP
jgi:hypothetical protein